MNRILKRMILCFALSIGILTIAQSEEYFTISKVSKNNETATIVLNNTIELTGITIVSSGTAKELILPKGIETNDENFKQQIINAIEYGVKESTNTSVSYQIGVIEEKENMKYVQIVFNEILRVQCSVINTEKGLQLFFPEGIDVQKTAFRKMIEKKVLRMMKKGQ